VGWRAGLALALLLGAVATIVTATSSPADVAQAPPRLPADAGVTPDAAERPPPPPPRRRKPPRTRPAGVADPPFQETDPR
jgi:hypothetical protein